MHCDIAESLGDAKDNVDALDLVTMYRMFVAIYSHSCCENSAVFSLFINDFIVERWNSCSFRTLLLRYEIQ